uniref:Secreted protein n=1 Tax=Meloidogyne javanica TaxID=6303 RepID=A0A915MUQ2_MELJA
MYRQILISFILFINLFVLPTTLNARVMQERVDLTINEEKQLIHGISTIINRKKRSRPCFRAAGAAIIGGCNLIKAIQRNKKD